MHPVSPWTWVYLAIGVACLGASRARHDCRGMGYGVAMLSSWFVTTVSFVVLGCDRAMYVVTVFDFGLGMFIAAGVAKEHSRRGLQIIGLFAFEMIVISTAALSGFWASVESQVVLNGIWTASVLIAGGRNALEIVTDWSGRGRTRVPVFARRH